MNNRIRFERPTSVIREQKQSFCLKQVEPNLGFFDLPVCFFDRRSYWFANQLDEVSLALLGKLINSNPEKAKAWVWDKLLSDPAIKQLIYLSFVIWIFKDILLKTF